MNFSSLLRSFIQTLSNNDKKQKIFFSLEIIMTEKSASFYSMKNVLVIISRSTGNSPVDHVDNRHLDLVSLVRLFFFSFESKKISFEIILSIETNATKFDDRKRF